MKKNVSHTYKGTESTNQERLRQQAIKDKEKERTQFYTEQETLIFYNTLDDQ